MARFEVFEGEAGLLLDLQSDLLAGLSHRIVVPLMAPNEAPRAAARLNPVLPIGTDQFVMMTQYMGAVPITMLSHPVADLSDHADTIAAALDMIFYGF